MPEISKTQMGGNMGLGISITLMGLVDLRYFVGSRKTLIQETGCLASKVLSQTFLQLEHEHADLW